MDILIFRVIFWSFIAGLACRLIPEKIRHVKESIALITCVVLFGIAISLFGGGRNTPPHVGWFLFDILSTFVFLAITFFGLVVTVYSFAYMKDRAGKNSYYAYILWTMCASIGAVFSNQLLLFASFWGFLAITLYLLINLAGEKAAASAKKTFIIVGGSDSLLILGIVLMWFLSGTFVLSAINITIRNGIGVAAFLCLVAASFAKAGAIPLHTWIPEISETAHVSVMAFLPASLDKLLGIYLLGRICINLFSFSEPLWLLLRFLGAFTIIAAVFMALIQHNMKKLLSYHAVSQVGYMVLGIASANPIGIAGGLFHMLNNTIYKCALFLGAGAVEEKTGTAELDALGGIGRFMPVTFACFLIASLAISGVPPLNGFFSKWMIYQGLFEGAKTGELSWSIFIIAAMLGSALTLASFMKVVHSVFLSNIVKNYKEKIIEVPPLMLIPSVILATLCVVLGFGYMIPADIFLSSIGFDYIPPSVGILLPSLGLFLIALIIGIILYLMLTFMKVRRVPSFVGGEMPASQMSMSGTEFYKTIEEVNLFAKAYQGAKNKLFDTYEVGKGILFYVGNMFRYAHNGILPTYLTWIIFGCVILLTLFMRI